MTSFIGGITLGVCFLIGFFGWKQSARRRACEIHIGLHGEAPDFAKLAGESGDVLAHLATLEHERISLKLEKLTAEELDTAGKFFYFLMQSLPIILNEAENREQWHRASRSKAFVKKAQEWLDRAKAYDGSVVTLPSPTPQELVEELAGLSTPRRFDMQTTAGKPELSPVERLRQHLKDRT